MLRCAALCEFLPHEQATVAFGARLIEACSGGAVIFLRGELGVGKTTLVRGVLRGLGHKGVAKSPTFTLVEPYQCGERRVFHFDLYRLADPEELEYLGARDYFDPDVLCLVEWPERGEGFLPEPDLRIELSYRDDGRQVRIQAQSEKGAAVLRGMLTTQA